MGLAPPMCQLFPQLKNKFPEMITYPEIYHNFLKFKMATVCMLDTRKTAKDHNLHNIKTFSHFFIKKNYPETIWISHNSGNFFQSGNTDQCNN